MVGISLIDVRFTRTSPHPLYSRKHKIHDSRLDHSQHASLPMRHISSGVLFCKNLRRYYSETLEIVDLPYNLSIQNGYLQKKSFSIVPHSSVEATLDTPFALAIKTSFKTKDLLS